MSHQKLLAGAAQQVITPPTGAVMSGWHFRAAGDNRARYVHDDLFVKALAAKCGNQTCLLLVADLVGIDPVGVASIREGITAQIGIGAEAILVCATHCHSGPAVCPVGSATNPEEFDRNVIQADGTTKGTFTGLTGGASTAYYTADIDSAWKEQFVSRAISAALDAWQDLRPAEIAYGQATASELGASRRRLLSDGSWADPRRDQPGDARIVAETQVDPTVRTIAFRDPGAETPRVILINYGSHPWIFSGSGFSAEIAGETARQLTGAFGKDNHPLVLYTSGPEGDVSLIGNIDIENVWRTQTGETREASLARREQGFGRELLRLGGKLANFARTAVDNAGPWTGAAEITACRLEVDLPLKPTYTRPPEVLVADWQRSASERVHRTEIQVFKIGDIAVLGLPGEPFTELGTAIRSQSPTDKLLITALSNDFGGISYIGMKNDYDQGGYELTHTPVAAGSGEILVEQAANLLAVGCAGREK